MNLISIDSKVENHQGADGSHAPLLKEVMIQTLELIIASNI